MWGSSLQNLEPLGTSLRLGSLEEMPTGITNSSLSPQDPSTQRQVSEKGPEGAWAPGGLSEEAPVFHQHEVLQPSKGGQRALDQLPGREWLSPPLPIMLLAGCLLLAPTSFPF